MTCGVIVRLAKDRLWVWSPIRLSDELLGEWLKFTAPPERRATVPKPCSVDDLVNRCRFAMHQAAWVVDTASGGQGRRTEKRIAGFHNHASARHAIPGYSPKQRHPGISMTRNNLESMPCSASPERCGEISTQSQTR
jgi:hypothetical protein